jgi:hypothetical protein
MKIYEIISENKQVDEGVASTVGSFLGKGLSRLGNAAASSSITKDAIADVAKEFARRAIPIQRAGKPVAAVNYGNIKKLIPKDAPRDVKRMLADPKNIAEIDKQVKSIMRNTHLTNIAKKVGLSKYVGASKWDLSKAVGTGIYRAYAGWQIAGMFSDYNSNVNAWDAELRKQLAAGKITQEQYDAQLAHIRKTEMGLLVTKVGAGLLGTAIAKGTVGPVAWLFNKIPFTAPIASIMTGLGRAGSAYVYSQLNSKEGSEMVAKVMVGHALGDAATSALGGVFTGAIDWLTGTAKKGQELDQSPQTGTPTAGAPQGASTTPVAKPNTTATTPTVAAATATAPVMPGDNKTATAQVDTPAGYTRDAAGNLILK